MISIPKYPHILVVPGALAQACGELGGFFGSRGYEPIFLPGITGADLDAGYAHIDNDVCASAVAIVGQLVNYLEIHPDMRPASVLVPELCFECRAISLPSLARIALDKARIRHIEVISFPHTELARIVKQLETWEYHTIEADEKPIGLCGPLPILTTGLFARAVEDTVERNGRRLVKPPLNALFGKRDVIAPAIDFFAGQGIADVICLLPFGCLSGHVFARGRMRALQKRYPAMNLSMLDYDPSASEVNLVNRVELTIQSS